MAMNAEKAFAYILTFGILISNKKEIIRLLKGGNGIFQMIEVLSGFCLVLFLFYSIEIIYGHVEPDHFILAVYLIGAGGGQIIKEAKGVFKNDSKQ